MVRPELTAVQLAPPSVLLNTPGPALNGDVPAYSVVGVTGSIAKAVMLTLVRPVTVQLSPPSVLLDNRNRPPPVVALPA